MASAARYHSAYTTALFVAAGLATMMIFVHRMFAAQTAGEPAGPAIHAVMGFLQAFEAIIAAGALLVGYLRVYRVPVAGPATAALSILLVAWLPIGTALFVWWLIGVRRQEANVFAPANA